MRIRPLVSGESVQLVNEGVTTASGVTWLSRRRPRGPPVQGTGVRNGGDRVHTPEPRVGPGGREM